MGQQVRSCDLHLRELHWLLPITFHARFKVPVLTYKILNSLEPCIWRTIFIVTFSLMHIVPLGRCFWLFHEPKRFGWRALGGRPSRLPSYRNPSLLRSVLLHLCFLSKSLQKWSSFGRPFYKICQPWSKVAGGMIVIIITSQIEWVLFFSLCS